MEADIDLIMESINDEDNGEEQEMEGRPGPPLHGFSSVTSVSRHAVNAARLSIPAAYWHLI